MQATDIIKVPGWFASIVVAAFIGWLSWMSVQIIGLKSDMGAVKERLQINTAQVGDDTKGIAKP
jgi:hypothetical protein